MTKDSLKKAFLHSAPVGFFMRNSQYFASVPFILGYPIMIAKASIENGALTADFHTAAGGFMVASAVFFAMKDKLGSTKAFKISAALGFMNGLCLVAQAYTTGGSVDDWSAPITGPLLANSMIFLHDKMPNWEWGKKFAASDSKIKQIFGRACQYPLVAAASVELINGIRMLKSAASMQDAGFGIALCLFGVGILGVLASDLNLKKDYEAAKLQKAAADIPPVPRLTA